MVSVSFGHYGSALLFGGAAVWSKVLATGVVLVVGAINIAGARFIDRFQTAIVLVLLAVFAVFLGVTVTQLDLSLLAPATYPSTSDIVASVALTFFAYLGFTVITFTGGDLPNPSKNLPRAMFLALGITTALYVLISAGVFATLTVDEVVESGDTALAVAARPVLGDAGVVMIAVAAMLSMSTSVNANLYAATGSTKKLAEARLFPPVFGQLAHVGGTRGLVISVVAVLLLVNLVDLSAIASLGSVVALAIFLVTASAAYRLRTEIEARTWVLVAAIALTAVVLVVFAVDTAQTAPETFTAMIAILALAVVLDLVWTRVRRRAP
jgi:amino acid transporter